MSGVTKRYATSLECESGIADSEKQSFLVGEKNLNNGELHGDVSMRRQLYIAREYAAPALVIIFLVAICGNVIIPDNLDETASRKPTFNSVYKNTNGNVNVDSKAHFSLWTYPESPPSSAWEATKKSYTSEHVILCSYTSCMEGARKANVPASRINLRELALCSPLYSDFVRNHMWYKVIHGKIFPHHVQAVAILSLLKTYPKACVQTLGAGGEDDSIICGDQMHQYDSYDPTVAFLEDPIKIPFYNAKVKLEGKFGILDYSQRVRDAKTANSGDELQTYAGLQFLPYLSEYVDREVDFPKAKGHLFANAWYGTKIMFPPAPLEQLQITMFSMHISQAMRQNVAKYPEYFHRYNEMVGPIGARDLPTLEFLQQRGIQTYLSLCFTTMINMGYDKSPSVIRERSLIMAVDVDSKFLPEDVRDRATVFECDIPDNKNSARHRYEEAFKLLTTYGRDAKVVITSRIHSALPAMAQGIPVIFVEHSDQRNLPGGGGGRTIGISNLFHLYDPETEWRFDLDNMGPNPGVHRADRYRASFWNYTKKRSTLYSDTAHLFGMLPMKRLGYGVPAVTPPAPLQSEFHFIFTTSEETLTWRVKRAIEAVFFHHPNAKVTMHSKTIRPVGSVLDIFRETGYDFNIQPYDIETLLAENSHVTAEQVEQMKTIIPIRRATAESWYSHETDLVRMLIIESNGGVYLDTDQHLVNPIPMSVNNMLGYQDQDDLIVNGAIMIFEKHNPFLGRLIERAVNIIIDRYDPKQWGIVGPDLITRIYKKGDMDEFVSVAKQHAFYPYEHYNVKYCFAGGDFPNPIHPTETYTVHLNTKISNTYHETIPGTVCDAVLHDYCIFCDEIHTNHNLQ